MVLDKGFKNYIWHVLEFLELTGKNGITQNPAKFIFGKKKLEFIGFKRTRDGFAPAPAIVKSIRKFPRPTNISGVRAWLGLVEQVSFAFSKTREMGTFRELLSSKEELSWNEER